MRLPAEEARKIMSSMHVCCAARTRLQSIAVKTFENHEEANQKESGEIALRQLSDRQRVG